MIDRILFFYVIGLLLFIIGLEERKSDLPNNIIYLGLAFFVNLMGYYISYTDADYTSAAYFPLILLVLDTLIMVWMLFEHLKIITSDDFKEEGED